jgi:hypothetical protein
VPPALLVAASHLLNVAVAVVAASELAVKSRHDGGMKREDNAQLPRHPAEGLDG